MSRRSLSLSCFCHMALLPCFGRRAPSFAFVRHELVEVLSNLDTSTICFIGPARHAGSPSRSGAWPQSSQSAQPRTGCRPARRPRPARPAPCRRMWLGQVVARITSVWNVWCLWQCGPLARSGTATVLDVNEGAVVCFEREAHIYRPHRALCRHGQPVRCVVRCETGTNALAFHLDAGDVDQEA